jgi:O-antigen ligase/tetratricopeptide (TPR) repeat protein
MLGRGRSIVALAFLTFVVGYAVVGHGGDEPFDSSLALLILGLVAIAGSFSLFAAASASVVNRGVVAAALLFFPAYIAFQLVPLPLAALRVVSPTRAEVADALAGIVATPRFAPLTISVANTSVHLARIAGCVLIFLLVRAITRHSAWGRWAASVPLIGLAVMEVAWAFAQSLADAPILGSYDNRNHFAGLLEMVMPFAAVYGIGVLTRGRHRGMLTGFNAVKGCSSVGIALAFFVAILFSLSKGGTFAALGSLVVMGVLAAEGRVSGWKRWVLTAALLIACVVTLAFLTPAALVARFAALGSDDVTEGRVPIWQDTLQMIRAYPLSGVGMGNFYPGLLRYQTAGLGVAWTAAHNDSLQLLSELGVVGFLFPAVAVGGAFVLAARASIAGATREAREMGLACAGGLAAFLIHSLSDFNAYVLSNAMVLAWIAGLSAAVDAPAANGLRDGSSTDPKNRAPSTPARAFALGAGSLLALYAGTWLIFLRSFHSDPAVERVFCRFGICDTDAAVAALQGPLRDTEPAAVPLEYLVEYLRRDPAAPYRWEDVGVALQRAGDVDRARYCVLRALALAPNSPPTLLMAANFQFDLGERRAALDLVSRSLRAGATFDEAVFPNLEERRIPVDEIVRYALPDRRSAQAYLHQLLRGDRFDDVDKVWEWMVRRGDANDKLANEYTEFRLRHKPPDAAARGWALYAGTKSAGYPQENRIFNGDFESEPTGNRFDWRIDAREGAAVDFDDTVRSSGRRSLQIRFDGTQNLGEIGVEQTVFLPPGRYRFQAYVRTQEISTDQGVAFRLTSENTPQPINVTTDALRGTNEWTLVERMVEAPPGGALTRLSIVRKPSLKFDNLIGGTAWIDRVSISPRN